MEGARARTEFLLSHVSAFSEVRPGRAEWSRTEDWRRAFEKAVRRKPLARRTRAEHGSGGGAREGMGARIDIRKRCDREREEGMEPGAGRTRTVRGEACGGFELCASCFMPQ